MFSIICKNLFYSFNYLLPLLLYVINSEAAGVIHGKYTENIKQYHLAVPHKATAEGEFATFHLPHFHDYDAKQFMKRRKRELDDPDAVHYGVSIDNQLHHVELWPNRDFLHPQATFERRDPTLPVHQRDVRGLKNKKMCYYLGRVRGVDNSRAALATCDGLVGYIHLGNKMYFIEPVHEHTPNAHGHHLHVVYPPNADAADHFCGVSNSPEHWEKSIKHRLREEYLNGKNIFKRESTYEVVPQWMETMFVCDKKMVVKHKGKRDIEQWVLTIGGIVKSFYSDQTMTGILQPVIVRIVYLEKEEEEIDLNINENCDTTLDNFCAWTRKLQPKDEDHPNHFDVAVLLSDWDFCDSTGYCLTQGLAYIGGGCSKDRNCQLNEDRGMLTPIIVSHEQGHLVGMNHDGQPPIPCPPNDTSDDSWYVMSPTGYLYTIRWSPCSTTSMQQLAQAHLLDCFNDEPVNDEYPVGDGMAGALYGVDEQCNMAKDIDTSLGSCLYKHVNCNYIFCNMGKDGCLQYGYELADGTKCGENKWCYKKKCETKGTRPSAVDGGWGEWGEWSPCSRSCGRGVQFMERLCDNPKPENHGKYCAGEARKFRVCNAQDCPVDVPSFREQQCKELFPKTSYVVSGMYKAEDLAEPFFKQDRPCVLFCKVKNGKAVSTASAIADGAKCEIGNPLKMCVSGVCTEVACDGKFKDSTAVVDQCGICNGDGTMCKMVEGSDNNASSKARVYRMVAVAPAGSRKVKFEEAEPSANILALGLPDDKTVYFNVNFKRKRAGIITTGSKNQSFVLYTQGPGQKENENVEALVWDRSREDIGLYVGHLGPKYKRTVKWSWVEVTDAPTREPKYHWDISEYKECSAKCEGGIQEPVIACIEEISGRVADSFCEKLDKPTEGPKKCNEQPCTPEWKVGEWGPCRACKKKGGVRIRGVQCVKQNPKNGEDILTEDSECKDIRPGTVELCETRKKCGSRKRKASYVPAKFQESIWQQMKKLHLTKRGTNATHVHLKGKATSSTKRTTAFTWTPPPLTTGKHYAIDDEKPGERSDPIKIEMKVVDMNDTKGDAAVAGPAEETEVVLGATVVMKGYTKMRIHAGKKNHTTTKTAKSQTTTTKTITKKC